MPSFPIVIISMIPGAYTVLGPNIIGSRLSDFVKSPTVAKWVRYKGCLEKVESHVLC